MNYLKRIKLNALIPNVVITVAYPLARALTYDGDKLLLFLDSLTIISFILMIVGVLYHLSLKGDFDRIRFTMSHSLGRVGKPYDQFLLDREEERKSAFNYPAFLGVVYFVGCSVVSLICY